MKKQHKNNRDLIIGLIGLALIGTISIFLIFASVFKGKLSVGHITKNSSSSISNSTLKTKDTTSKSDVIDVQDFTNNQIEHVEFEPIITIYGDSKVLYSTNYTKLTTSKVNINVDKKVKEGYLYVVMSGNIVSHNLESDESIFDGIAPITNGKSQFFITYDNNKRLNFVINIPNS